jgi:WD40 repeat protein
LYEGKEGKMTSGFGEGPEKHTGSIFSVAWSPDGKRVLSSSADMTVKLWDVSTQKLIRYKYFNFCF